MCEMMMGIFPSLFVTSLFLSSIIHLTTQADVLTYSIPEELSAGHEIGNVLVDSRLSSRHTSRELDIITFRLLSSEDMFEIDDIKGDLKSSQRLDREALCQRSETCEFDIDIATGPAQLFSVISVQLQLQDINDNPPTFLDDFIEREISEAAPVGSVISLSQAYDQDLEQNGVTGYNISTNTDK